MIAAGEALKASIIIPVVDNLKITEACLDSIKAHTQIPHEVIVVDNGSKEPVADMARHKGAVIVRHPKNRGFAAAVNAGIRAAEGEHLVVLNNDTVVTPHWLGFLLRHFGDDPKLGVLAPVTNYASGPQRVKASYQNNAGLRRAANQVHNENWGKRLEFPRVIGMCMVIPREVQRAVGTFDEQFGIGNFEDDDFCLRVRKAGYRVAIAQDVFIHHHGSRTFAALGYLENEGKKYGELLDENRAKFAEKWGMEPAEAHACVMNPV